jgi:hypothetical protein
MGADEAAASVIPRRKLQEQRGRDHSLSFVSTQLNKGVLILIIKSLHLFKSIGIFILGITLQYRYEHEIEMKRLSM